MPDRLWKRKKIRVLRYICSMFDTAMKRILYLLACLWSGAVWGGVPETLMVGAERFEMYMPALRGKRLAVVTNQTGVVRAEVLQVGLVGEIMGRDSCSYRHIVDVWIDSGLGIQKIFSPEHGFRGNAEAGASVRSGVDASTGLPVVSLYGSHKKPLPDDMQGIDAVIFDLQDVGVRFYTYISTLHYVMEACAETGIPLWVLDRPNPHAFYTDGPLLDTACCRSFVGMHPVPVVYGMTIGEYARMINGEAWLAKGVRCALQVIPLRGYNRNSLYVFPVPPSPNLQSMKAIHAYPSLCFFEGTPVSVGRGTETPFECFGFPGSTAEDYRFTPHSIAGVSQNPPFKDKECTGYRVADSLAVRPSGRLDLEYLLSMWRVWPSKDKFFNAFFVKLAGTQDLAEQIRQGATVARIRASWQPELKRFEETRRKYLLYP